MKKYFEIDGQKLEVVFDLYDDEEINDFQKECYDYVEKNFKKLYKQAIKDIKKLIKTKEFHERYIDEDLTEKQILNSIVFNAVYFARTDGRGFGFLGGWEADIEHGLGVKFIKTGEKVVIKEIEGQDCLL